LALWRQGGGQAQEFAAMEMLARYLEKAAALERMADEENDAKLKADSLALADAYRKAAAHRAEHLNLPNPPKSNQ
jgi:hypothetical protein